jgi:exosortase D (VPLPA-CTERM-specific)
MSATSPALDAVAWREPWAARFSFLLCGAALLLAFRNGLVDLVGVWGKQPEYSYGYAIPFVAAYFLWQKRGELERQVFTGSWIGTGLVALGLACLVLGTIATLGTIVQYGFLVALVGVVLAYTGASALRAIAGPLAILAFMVPLPNYLLLELSQWLQLVSSQLGVAVIRAFGVSVYLEGNVIDLGSLKLQVVEACNGLRYLFPLAALGFIAAYLYRVELWKRVLIVASTLPITVLMNSFRIGLIGVAAEYGGKAMAEGLLHDFEGWIIFLACLGLLALQMWLLTHVGRNRRPLREVFGLEAGPAPIGPGARANRVLPNSYLAACALLVLAAAGELLAPAASQAAPARKPLRDFPMELEAWKGEPERLEAPIVQALKLDDYVIAEYSEPQRGAPVNFYISYYAAQANGNSAHSPRACIPGDGWEISAFGDHVLPEIRAGGAPLHVNRAVIQKGERRQLVYYWFQQRGRFITNEYSAKLWIFWDALTRQRSDGAMVRLVARLRAGEPLEVADQQLARFAQAVFPTLPEYIPE